MILPSDPLPLWRYALFLSGETGIGKSTLINTLFNTNFEELESSHFCPCVRLRAETYELQESNVRLKLTIVNTVGFGDQINKEDRYVAFVCPLSCNKTSFISGWRLPSSSSAAILFSAEIIHDFASQTQFYSFLSLATDQCFGFIDKFVFFYRVVIFL